MTTEDRLREALAATAALVHLEDQPQTKAVPARAHRRIAPLAVAAAVLFILAGVVFGLRGGGDPAPAVSPGGAAPARYFMAKIGDGNTTKVSVRDIQTGRVTATVAPPVHGQWRELSATADPHVFYAASLADFGSRDVETSLYRLTIDATGRLRTRTKVGGPDQEPADRVRRRARRDARRLQRRDEGTGSGDRGSHRLQRSAYGLPDVDGRVRVVAVVDGRRAAPGLSAPDADGHRVQRPDPRHPGRP